jgi:hypothetical protein
MPKTGRPDQTNRGADREQTPAGTRPKPARDEHSAGSSRQGERGMEKRGATYLCGEVLEEAVLADAVLEAELLPELHPDLVPTLPHLDRDDLARHLLRPFLPSPADGEGLGFWACLVWSRVECGGGARLTNRETEGDEWMKGRLWRRNGRNFQGG